MRMIARARRIDVAEVSRQREARDRRQHAGQLDACRTAADDHEGHVGRALRGVGRALGALEREQPAPAKLDRVLDALEARRERFPLVVAEVRVPRAGGDDEIIIIELVGRPRSRTTRASDRCASLRSSAPRCSLLAQQPADRRRDVARRQRRRRDLIEQRLEDVVVGAIDDRDVDGRVCAARAPRRVRRSRRR